MSREWAVPLSIGEGNAVLPPACNFQPRQSTVIFNLPLSEHEALVLPLRSSLLTHYLSCLKGERKQEAGLQSPQDCSTDCLISSAYHRPSSQGEAWSIILGKGSPHCHQSSSCCSQVCSGSQGSALRAAHGLGRARNTHLRVVRESFSPKEWKGRTSHIWAKSMCERGEGCSSPVVISWHLSRVWTSSPFLTFWARATAQHLRAAPGAHSMGQSRWKFQQQQETEYAQCKDMRARCDTGMAKYSWLKTCFVRLN